MGFGAGLGRAIAAGVTGFDQGRSERDRELAAEAARRATLARQERLDAMNAEQHGWARDDRQAEMAARGVVPASTSVDVESPPEPRPQQPKSFGDALQGGLGPYAPASKPEGGAVADPAPSLDTTIKQGSLGTVPKVRVLTTPAHYDPSQDRAQILEQKKEAAAQERALALEAARAAAATAGRTQTHGFRMQEIGATQAGEDRRSKMTHAAQLAGLKDPFDQSLDHAVQSALGQIEAGGVKNATPAQIHGATMNVVRADPKLRAALAKGTISSDRVWAAITAHREGRTVKGKEEDTSWMDESAPSTPVTSPTAGGKAAQPHSLNRRGAGPATVAPTAGAAPDDVLQELDTKFHGDEPKIRAELRKRGYDPDA